MKCYIEGEEYDLTEELLELRKNCIFAHEIFGKSIVFKCVGFIYFRQTKYFIFPKGYSISLNKSERISGAKTVMQSIKRFEGSVSNSVNVRKSRVNETSENIVRAAMSIIEKYIENGSLFIYSKKMSVDSKGKIDWHKTIKRTHPYTKDGQIFYPHLHSSKRTKNYYNELTMLHEKILLICYHASGFLYGFDIEYEKVERTIKHIESNKQYYLSLVQKARANFFDDYTLSLLEEMEIVLTHVGESINTEASSLTVEYYYAVWEQVLSYIFVNEYHNYSQFFPKFNIQIRDKIEFRSQIPDIVYNERENLILIDAKYYSIQKKLPGKDDFIKQYIYEWSYTGKVPILYNCLAFSVSSDEIVEKIGEAKFAYNCGQALESQQTGLGYIHLIGIDINNALESYVQRRKSNVYKKCLMDALGSPSYL